MKNNILYVPGSSAVCRVTRRELIQRGVAIEDQPSRSVTHLLLPVPSFEADGRIRGGGILEHVLADLPDDVKVIGGNLNHPALDGYHKVDLLRDARYVARNAAITADCAIRIAAREIPVIFEDCAVLVVGWGRIGKCLASQLKAMGARVTVACRKESDRAMAEALGYGTEDSGRLLHSLCRYRLIFNTAPSPVLTQAQLAHCREDCVKIDLASQPGIEGENVIRALGLPGKLTPESSGLLIAKTVIRLFAESEVKK